MLLYRITNKKYLENFSGLGASYIDGARWNLAGEPAIYFTLAPSVALLEMGNYIPKPSMVPPFYRLAEYFFDDEQAAYIKVDDLPKGWNSYPHKLFTQQIGSNFLSERAKPLLIVPSAAVPAGLESIVLFNPLHPLATNIQLKQTFNPIYNSRIFSG